MTVPYIRQRRNPDLLDRRRAYLTARQNWALDWQCQGLNIKAIAEGLGVSTSATQKILARARKNLRLTKRQGYVPDVQHRHPTPSDNSDSVTQNSGERPSDDTDRPLTLHIDLTKAK